jgi:hypothetical protein
MIRAPAETLEQPSVKIREGSRFDLLGKSDISKIGRRLVWQTAVSPGKWTGVVIHERNL